MDTSEILGREYWPRAIDGRVQELLQVGGALVIEGPRACGKTMTGLKHSNSYTLLDAPAQLAMAEVSPQTLLEGESPRLLDEWQVAPILWNLVRRAVDSSTIPGRFILTGSSVPADDTTRHTGAGRFLRLRQRTMSWQEKRRSTGAVSLQKLFAGEAITPSTNMPELAEIIESLLIPGFPAMAEMLPEQGRLLMDGYIDDVVRADIPRLVNTRQQPETLRQLIRSIARLSASELKFSTLAADLNSVAPDISPATLSNLVGVLERLFVVDTVPAWTPKLRSRARLRTSPKTHLADPALAAAALDADADALKADLPTLGFLFVSAVVHDLMVYADALGGTVHHYRDSNGHEIDAIISLPGGKWGAIEVKLGGLQAKTGAESLKKAVANIAARTPPSFCAVITGTGMTAPLGDGIITFPLSTLGL